MDFENSALRWGLNFGIWNIKYKIWSLESVVWRDKFRLELSAVSEGGTESDLISKGEVDAEWKSTG